MKITRYLVLLAVFCSLAACNTTAGLGQDVEKLGEGMQNASRKAQR